MLLLGSIELYYIINNVSGNYYKRNKKNNKLSKAKNKSDAEKFTYIEAMTYIKGGNDYNYSIVKVDDEEEDIFTSIENDIVDDYEEEIIQEHNEVDTILKYKEEGDDKNSTTESYNFTIEYDDMMNIDWTDLATNLYYITKNIYNYEKNIREMLSNVDKEITDILHYIEFKELDDEEMIKATKMLQDRRRYRRIVKDEYSKIIAMRNIFSNGSFRNKIEECYDEIESMQHRYYSPRKLNDLFNSTIN